jgi:hypothetical protein
MGWVSDLMFGNDAERIDGLGEVEGRTKENGANGTKWSCNGCGPMVSPASNKIECIVVRNLEKRLNR